MGLNVEIIETLAIKNVESYFNYKTAGENFDLVSTVLSNLERKRGCQENCTELCKYSLRELFNLKITHKDVLSEIIKHGHPSYRVMSDKKARNSTATREELSEHYKYAHDVK